ncbi:hypothetical protein PEX1_057840 [Penicillium expansum]|uniref:Uncharacterized protein n=1 Tax=Penicillium expansum TaxID=27334 RepID=A0A0A2IJ98_PENEN|nr:hypothetical protein PEX2_023510 [Penicillium expansum]KGO43134.1 hypothetical protein PEXP_028520 [Penicillium expansum]KGO53823.1 hypothetical protein PEX2_023510 [Penicillium expansum]KGO72821.1 hypothetical protein PEX1_057840 [Penicillium expansum]
MPEASTGPRSEFPPLVIRGKHPQENCELQPVAIFYSPTVTSLDLEAKANSHSSSDEVPDSGSAFASDNSSPDSSDSSSDDESDTFSSNGSNSSSPNSSSPDSLHTTFPDSNILKPSDLFDDGFEENVESQLRAAWDTSSQSDSDAETVILCNPTARSDSDTVSTKNFDPEESGTVSGDFIQGDPRAEKSDTSDSASDNGSDSSSQEFSDTFSPTGPRSHSPASSTSSQDSLDIDDDEPNLSEGSHYICAYASPVHDGHRIRTSCDRNDDTGIWHVEPDGFINEAKRAGGPYLCSFPVKMQKLKPGDPLSDVLEDFVLIQKILASLDEHNVHPISMKLRECEHEKDLFNWTPTLIFSAIRNTFDDSWILACRQIWKHFSDAGLGQVNIEISDPEMYTRSLWPIQKSDPVWSVHEELQRRMMAEIDLTDMCAIMTIHVGMTQDREKMPLAVFMVVRYQSTRDWRDTRDLLVGILDDLNLPMVGVVITKGETLRG